MLASAVCPFLLPRELTTGRRLTVRKAIDVGVHREARARWTSSVLEDQLRKRAFWMLYSLDRTLPLVAPVECAS